MKAGRCGWKGRREHPKPECPQSTAWGGEGNWHMGAGMRFLTRDILTPPSSLQMGITTSTSSRATTTGWCLCMATPATHSPCRCAGLASLLVSMPLPGPRAATSSTSSKVGEQESSCLCPGCLVSKAPPPAHDAHGTEREHHCVLGVQNPTGALYMALVVSPQQPVPQFPHAVEQRSLVFNNKTRCIKPFGVSGSTCPHNPWKERS